MEYNDVVLQNGYRATEEAHREYLYRALDLPDPQDPMAPKAEGDKAQPKGDTAGTPGPTEQGPSNMSFFEKVGVAAGRIGTGIKNMATGIVKQTADVMENPSPEHIADLTATGQMQGAVSNFMPMGSVKIGGPGKGAGAAGGGSEGFINKLLETHKLPPGGAEKAVELAAKSEVPKDLITKLAGEGIDKPYTFKNAAGKDWFFKSQEQAEAAARREIKKMAAGNKVEAAVSKLSPKTQAEGVEIADKAELLAKDFESARLKKSMAKTDESLKYMDSMLEKDANGEITAGRLAADGQVNPSVANAEGAAQMNKAAQNIIDKVQEVKKTATQELEEQAQGVLDTVKKQREGTGLEGGELLQVLDDFRKAYPKLDPGVLREGEASWLQALVEGRGVRNWLLSGRAPNEAMIAERLAWMETPKDVLRMMAPAKSGADWWKYHFVGKLLKPASVIANFTGTIAIPYALELPAKYNAALKGSIARYFGQQEGGATWAGANSYGYALGSVIGDAFGEGWRSFKSGAPRMGQIRQDLPMMPSMSPEMMDKLGPAAVGLNWYLSAVGATSRGMMAGDEIIKALGAHAQGTYLATNDAHAMLQAGKITREQFGKVVSKIRESRYMQFRPQYRAEAEEHAFWLSLNKEAGPIGQHLIGLRDAVDKIPVAGPALGTGELPFVRTLINIPKMAAQYSPAGFLHPGVGRIAEKITGQLNSVSQVAKDDMYGRAMWGSMLAMGVLHLQQQGALRGRFATDVKIRHDYNANGVYEDTIKLGSNWYSFARLNPAANLLGLYADIGQVWHLMDQGRKKDAATIMMLGAVNFMSAGFLQDMGNVFNMVSGAITNQDELLEAGKKFGLKVMRDATPSAGAISSVYKTIQDMRNPYVMGKSNFGLPKDVAEQETRIQSANENLSGEAETDWADVRGALEEFMAEFPGYNQYAEKIGLTPTYAARNVLGEKVEKPHDPFGLVSIDPFFATSYKDNEILKEICFLKPDLARPGKTIEGVPLTAKEADLYAEMVGTNFKERMEQEMAGWHDGMSDQVKKDAIVRAYNQSLDRAKDEAKGNDQDFPELSRLFGEVKQGKGEKKASDSPVQRQPDLSNMME